MGPVAKRMPRDLAFAVAGLLGLVIAMRLRSGNWEFPDLLTTFLFLDVYGGLLIIFAVIKAVVRGLCKSSQPGSLPPVDGAAPT